jgi:hypothetical protein
MEGDLKALLEKTLEDTEKGKLFYPSTPISNEERAKLKSEDFAVPEERQFPLHDEDHAKFALDQVSKITKLSQYGERVRAAVQNKYPHLQGET